MAGSVNKVILIGNLGADPEIRHMADGRPAARMRIATSQTWHDKATGERRERTEWHTVVVFAEGLAKLAEQYLKKGAKVYVEGELQTRKWTDQAGADRYSTEVVLQAFRGRLEMLGGRRDGTGWADTEARGLDPDRAAGTSPADNYRAASQGGTPATQESLDMQSPADVPFDDDVPF